MRCHGRERIPGHGAHSSRNRAPPGAFSPFELETASPRVRDGIPRGRICELDREDGAIEIGPPDAGFGGLQPTIILSPSSNPRTGKLPLHIDVNPVDRDQDAELERLLALGARPADVGQTGDEQWHVLADPEGNEFCLLRRRLEPLI